MQTSFQTTFNQYMIGMVENSLEQITLMPTATIEFGTAVTRGTTEGSVSPIAVDATTAKVVGVAVLRQNDHGNYLVSEEAGILTKGNVAVPVLSTDTVKGGDNAYMIVASTNYGKFTKTAGSNTVACGVFQGVKKNNIAIVKLDIVA